MYVCVKGDILYVTAAMQPYNVDLPSSVRELEVRRRCRAWEPHFSLRYSLPPGYRCSSDIQSTVGSGLASFCHPRSGVVMFL